MLLAATLSISLAQPPPTVVLRDEGKEPRLEIVQAALPFPRGMLREPRVASVEGAPAALVPLLHWPDGSIALAQLHVELELPGTARRELVVALPPTPPRFPEAAAWPEAAWQLRAEVVDPFGQRYTASLEHARWTVVRESPLVRIERTALAHTDDKGRGFLGLVAWRTRLRGRTHGELTLLLDNGKSPHLSSPPLGPVRLRGYSVVTQGGLRLVPRQARENLIAVGSADGGGERWQLLGPSGLLYLGDATGKAFRFDWAIGAAPRRPAVLALPAVAWTRHTGAFGAHGGPAPPLGGDRTLPLLEQLRARADYGPFGGQGDAKDAAENGTPRNGPSALHNVLRCESPPLLAAAEAAVLQQCLRPPAGRPPRLPDDMAAFRAGLSPRAIAKPHGFTALDYEHYSVDAWFDWYWLTGDPLAFDELALCGRDLQPLLERLPFLTSRGEGWCLQAGVSIARATHDQALLARLLARHQSLVRPRLGEAPQPFAIAQPPHADAFGPGVEFDAPWQMAALVHGLVALWRATGALDLVADIERVADVMAGPGWVEGKGPKTLVSAADAGRYTLPTEHDVTEGTAVMQLGAFVLAAEATDDPARQELYRRRAAFLAAAHERNAEAAATSPWFQVWFDRK